jgi:hypothetical protein
VQGKTVEIGWLARRGERAARYQGVTLEQAGL